MKVEQQQHGTVCVVTPHGPLVSEDLDDVQRTLRSAVTQKAGRVVLDMGEVPYVDSGGLECLLELCTPGPSGAQPRLARLGDTCREALDLTNVLERLDVFDTVENAIRSYKR